MSGFSDEDIYEVITGLIKGLRSGGVDDAEVSQGVSEEYRRIINFNWASAEHCLSIAERVHEDAGIAPPEWLRRQGEPAERPDVSAVGF